jgi:MFS family permease
VSETAQVSVPQANVPLPRSVWLLSWVSFFADVSSEMVYPLLPLYLISVLGSSKTQLGVIEGCAVLIVSLMSAVAGFRSDRKGKGGGRVPWIRWGYGLPVIGKSIIAMANVWPLVLGGRLLDRFGKGLRGAPRDALIADAVSKDQRGRAFGMHRAFDTAGALLGVLLSAFLLWWLTGTPQKTAAAEALNTATVTPAWVFRTIFGVGAALGLASTVLTFLVRESEPADRPDDPPLEKLAPPTNPDVVTTTETSLGEVRNEHSPGITQENAHVERRPTGWIHLPRQYWAVLGVLILFSLANSSDTFLLLRASELGFSAWGVVLVYAVYNITYSALSYPAGVLSDKLGRWNVIAVGWVIYVISYTGFALLPASLSWGMWPLMAIYGVYMALTDGVGKALIADYAPREVRGTAMGLFYALTGLTTLGASLLAGAVWDRSGSTLALLIGAGCAILALGALPLIRRQPV